MRITLLLLLTTVADLSWMAGHWSATIDGVQMEEVWTAPDGGMLLGLHRDVKNGRAQFEFMRIARTEEGIFFFAQPGGRPPTPFRLTHASDTRVVFEKPDHDFPKRIIYELREGKLCARVDDGGENAEEWCWAKR